MNMVFLLIIIIIAIIAFFSIYIAIDNNFRSIRYAKSFDSIKYIDGSLKYYISKCMNCNKPLENNLVLDSEIYVYCEKCMGKFNFSDDEIEQIEKALKESSNNESNKD